MPTSPRPTTIKLGILVALAVLINFCFNLSLGFLLDFLFQYNYAEEKVAEIQKNSSLKIISKTVQDARLKLTLPDTQFFQFSIVVAQVATQISTSILRKQ